MKSKTKKILIASICAALLIALGVVIVYALVTKEAEGSSDNTFIPGRMDCAVVSDGSGYAIRNDGNTDAYVRAVVLVNWKKSDGSYYPRTTNAVFTTESNWTKDGEIHYYTVKVPSGGSTSKLIVDKSTITAANTNAPAGTTLEIRVLAEAIQGTWGTYSEAWDAAMNGGTIGEDVRPEYPAPDDPKNPDTCQHSWYGICTQPRTCTICGTAEENAPGSHISVTPYEDVAATCTTTGSTGGSMCTAPGCGVEIEAATILPELGHEYDPSNNYKCVRCDKYLTLDDLDVSATDLQANMQSIFGGDTVFQETVMFLNSGETKQLLFPIDEIVSVQSYDGFTTYVEGRDYEIVDGKLYVPPTSTIKFITDKNYFKYPTSQYQDGDLVWESYKGTDYCVYWGDITAMTQWQVRVIYKHSGTWDGFKQQNYINQFDALIKKLMTGQDVTFIFYGDSITCGATSSWYFAVPTAAWYNPNETFYQWSYSMLFTQAIADMFGYTIKFVDVSGLNSAIKHHPEDYVGGTNGTITFINPSVGGWRSEHGLSYFDAHIKPYMEQYGCDLFGVAFGMNDINYDASTFTAANVQAIYEKAMAIDSDFHGLVIASMMPNNILRNFSANKYTNFKAQETYLQGVVDSLNANGHGSALVKMTSMSSSMLDRIDFRSYSANNYNHPNDFMERVYAQTCLQAVIGYENINPIPAHDHTEVTIPSKEAKCSANGLTEGKMCSICYQITDPPEVIAPTEHTLNNGVCTSCKNVISYGADVLAAVANGVANVTATVQGNYVNYAVSGSNPTIALHNSDVPLKRFMLIRYRGYSTATGTLDDITLPHNGYGKNYDFYLTINRVKYTGGQAKNPNWFNLNLDNQWHYIIVDLGTEAVTWLTWTLCDGTVTDEKCDSLDVEYVEFYDTYAEAKAAEVARHPDGNIYPTRFENGSSLTIIDVAVPPAQVYYAHSVTNGFYSGNAKLEYDEANKHVTMHSSYVNQGYGNIIVTASLRGTYDPTTLGLQIGDSPVTWGVVTSNGQASGYWVICNVSDKLALGETKPLKVLIANPDPTVSEETVLVLDTLTITMYDDCQGNHSWTAATCDAPRTCTNCHATDGSSYGHTWVNATCTSPKTCSTCGATEGTKLEHNFVNDVCTICGAGNIIPPVDTPDDTPVSRVQNSPYTYFRCGSCGYVSHTDGANIAGSLSIDAFNPQNNTSINYKSQLLAGSATVAQPSNGYFDISGWVGVNSSDYTLGWSIGSDDLRWWSCTETKITASNDPEVLNSANSAGYTNASRFTYTLPWSGITSGDTIHLLVKDNKNELIYCFCEFKVIKSGEKDAAILGSLDNFVHQTTQTEYNSSITNNTLTITETEGMFEITGWIATSISNYSLVWRLNEDYRYGDGGGYKMATGSDVTGAASNAGYNYATRFKYFFPPVAINSGDMIHLYVKDESTGALYCFASYTIFIQDSVTHYSLNINVTNVTVDNNKVTAPYEDAELKMWFDHLTEKVARYDTSNIDSTDYSYTIQMARNEMEGCHFYLYSTTSKKVTIKLSDFTNDYGETLETELGVEYYIRDDLISMKGLSEWQLDVNGEKEVGVYADGVVPYESYIKAGYGNDEGGNYEYGTWVPIGPYAYEGTPRQAIRGFTINATTLRTSRPGKYSATVEIYDYSTGQCIKKANVYTYVYDVILSDDPALDTYIGSNFTNVDGINGAYGGIRSQDAIVAQADLMLKYRLTPGWAGWAYDSYFDLAWMSNPRVTSIRVHNQTYYNNWMTQIDKISDPILKQKVKDKLVFYGQDEPGVSRMTHKQIMLENGSTYWWYDPFGFLSLISVAEQAKMLQSWGWEDYRLLIPFERNNNFKDLLNYPYEGKDGVWALNWDVVRSTLTVSGSDLTPNTNAQALYDKYKVELESSEDMVDFMSNYVNVWVYSYIGSTPKAINNVNGCLYMQSAVHDAIYGEFADRMRKYQAMGDEIWSYVACEPEWDSPYQNILLFNDGTEARTMMWTCYKLGQTGWLYWKEDNYTDGALNKNTPTCMALPWPKEGPGDGILLYPGAIYGQAEPIPSIRMMNLRDGVEDYELLCMIEEKYGEAKAHELVSKIVTSTVTYTRDDDRIYNVHVELLQLLEAAG